ncbi:MAG: hypothetical protein ACOYNI_04765 [Acidimicrobiia bacterium]
MGVVLAAVGGMLAASVVFVLTVVTAGAGVRALLRRPIADHPTSELALCMVTSVAVTAIVGGVLLAVRWFVPVALVVVLLGLAAGGVVRTARLAASLWRAEGIASVIGLAVIAPAAPMLAANGYAPAETYRWYYWDLGRQLTRARGVPSYVLEYGERFRWLPDYLVFNLHSEAYRMLVPGGDAFAMQWWIVPTVFFFSLFAYSVFRLWVARVPAAVGVFALAATYWFAQKFNSYKPEAFGILLGLIAVLLITRGLRKGRASMLVAAGVALGLALAVHAIAATVLGMLVVAAALVEWWAQGHHWRAAVAVVAAGCSALVVAGALGIALQGRALVITDANRPTPTAGSDATRDFLQRQVGEFDVKPPRPPLERAWSTANRMWPDVRWSDASGIVVLALVVIGLGAATLRGDRRTRAGITIVALFNGALVAVILYFALAYDTFVPQNTGTSRFAQYAPLAIVGFVPFAVGGYLQLVAGIGVRSRRIAQGALVAVAAAVMVVSIALVGADRSNSISASGSAAFRFLDSQSAPNEVMLCNAGTRGTFEFFTDLQNPLESRQPVIESPRLLRRAADSLLESHRFFLSEPNSSPPFDGIRFVVMVSDPARVGADVSYGGSAKTFAANAFRFGFRAVWNRDGIAVFDRGPGVTPRPQGPAQLHLASTALAAVAAALFFAVVTFGLRRLGPLDGGAPAPGRAAPPATDADSEPSGPALSAPPAPSERTQA